ncbi:hypothetical protein ACIRSU_32060 [Streptomyces sp. NPDC101160]|uniref:hypothetical protein n=1 Tax=Streptomyces sp. NPDC101160 TaxID=3366118 RepID=UPI00382260CA
MAFRMLAPTAEPSATTMNRTTSRGTALRWTAAFCALASAVLHLLLVPSHLEEMPYIGVLFLVGGVVLLAVAVGLVARRRPLVAGWVGAATSVGMIVGFVLSRTVGLPGFHETDWEPPYGILSLVAEGVFVLAFVMWVATASSERPR